MGQRSTGEGNDVKEPKSRKEAGGLGLRTCAGGEDDKVNVRKSFRRWRT